MVKSQWLARLAGCASFFAFSVIALGAFTRLIDAGLGCPDWPGCYGYLFLPVAEKTRQFVNLAYPHSPFIAYKAWAEMIHRYFAATLSIFIMAIIALTLKVRGKVNVMLALCLLGLVSYQIVLGQLTVTLKLSPVIVTQHLLGGFLILSMLWLTYLYHSQPDTLMLGAHLNKKLKMRLTIGALLGLVMLVCQILLGAWTSTNYASLSCPDFPFCKNNPLSIPFDLNAVFQRGYPLSETSREAIQMLHRIGALIVISYLLIYYSLALSKIRFSFSLLKTAYLVLGLLCLQACLGIANVLFKLPLLTAICHTIVAALLLITFLTFIFKLLTIPTHA